MSASGYLPPTRVRRKRKRQSHARRVDVMKIGCSVARALENPLQTMALKK
jgi:hypothetical protein